MGFATGLLVRRPEWSHQWTCGHPLEQVNPPRGLEGEQEGVKWCRRWTKWSNEGAVRRAGQAWGEVDWWQHIPNPKPLPGSDPPTWSNADSYQQLS